MQSTNKKPIIIGAILLGIIITAGILLSIRTATKDPGQSGLYKDPGSGETVSDPPGKSPESYNQDSIGLVYLGFTKLIDTGLTKDQVDAVKESFAKYSEQRANKIKEVSITVATVKADPINMDSDIRTIRFEVTINRGEKLNAEVQYMDFDSANLLLSMPGSKEYIYQSGFVKPYYATPSNELESDPVLD